MANHVENEITIKGPFHIIYLIQDAFEYEEPDEFFLKMFEGAGIDVELDENDRYSGDEESSYPTRKYMIEMFGAKWVHFSTVNEDCDLDSGQECYIVFSCTSAWAPVINFLDNLREMFPEISLYATFEDEYLNFIGSYDDDIGEVWIDEPIRYFYSDFENQKLFETWEEVKAAISKDYTEEELTEEIMSMLESRFEFYLGHGNDY